MAPHSVDHLVEYKLPNFTTALGSIFSVADQAQLLGKERQDFDLVDGHGFLLAAVCILDKT